MRTESIKEAIRIKATYALHITSPNWKYIKHSYKKIKQNPRGTFTDAKEKLNNGQSRVQKQSFCVDGV